MNEKISVIVPVYNVEKYVCKCLDSLIAQTYTNLEIICIDDGSTDNSGRFCDEYAKKDGRIVVFHKPNGGVASARNVGLDLFTGKYLGYVDPDDWIEPTMYEKLYNDICISDDIDISSCGYFRDFPDGRCVQIINEVTPDSGSMTPERYMYHVYQRDYYRNVSGYSVLRLFNSRFFKEMNFRFDESLVTTEDVFMFVKCVINSRKLIYRDENLYHYYQRESSLYHNVTNRLDTLDDLAAYQFSIDSMTAAGFSEDVIQYAKRFYCYHASLLLEYAIKIKNVEKIFDLKKRIHKYLDTYIRTNSEYPERIIRINKLLNYNLRGDSE